MTRNEPELASSAGGGFTGLQRCLASGSGNWSSGGGAYGCVSPIKELDVPND